MIDEKSRAALGAVPLFAAFREQPPQLAIVADAMVARSIPAGTVVIREGESGDEMFVLLRGEVEVSKTTIRQEKFAVARLFDRDHTLFGELALVDDEIRSATITAVTDCEVLVLTRKAFDELGDAHPDIGLPIQRALAKQVARRLRATNADVLLLFDALVREVEARELG